jgi:hypothetical protein
MERQTPQDAASNITQNQSSHSYSAWRTAQQEQPRIFQYNPQQAGTHQHQQQQKQQTSLSSQSAAGAAPVPIPANIDNTLIFQNNGRLAPDPQYNLQNPASQAFTALPEDPHNETPQTPDDGTKDDQPSAPNGRVLSSTKRAAQNRAAQRAFRERKDRYIKSLEQKAQDHERSASIVADLRKENIYLRDYVVRLQNEVDSLNTELGRAPMFTAPTQQQQTTATVQPQTQAVQPQTMQSVPMLQNYTVNSVPTDQSGLSRLAPALGGSTTGLAGEQAGVQAEGKLPGKKAVKGRKKKESAD